MVLVDEHVRPVSDKTMSASELLDGGFIQEVNRRFFHPLGLALGVDPDAAPRADGSLLMTVYDVRDDPEGMFFYDLDTDEARYKAEVVHALAWSKRQVRIERMRDALHVTQVDIAELPAQPIGTSFPEDTSD